MKLGRLLLSGITVYGAYKVYQNRDCFKENFKETRSSFKNIKRDITNIQDDITLISQQLDVISDYKKDLTYKFQVFHQNTQSYLEEIEQRLQKWQ
ncbi:hypothetical protein ACVR0S_00370 [Streptococcus dentapri]|uniref:Chemotaxis protein n=1 Tax=Streptococcus dentapri TaxID=573564 RepID=A0ABV8D285_9STRE